MIRTEEGYRSAKNALALAESALEALRKDEERYHPKTFAALQDPYVDEIERLRAELRTYPASSPQVAHVDSVETTV